jgi:ribosomal protein S12 methylthiotransferase accessory factor
VRALAARCGVTRLADITGLDRLGLPVWQAVRPAGRALSVHQGKGATALAAGIGALCEAIESHCAERVPADGPLCAFDDLPGDKAGLTPSDFSRSRRLSIPSDPIQWCRATDLLTGGEAHLPHDLVSLDFRVSGETWFDRSSNGLAVGAREEEAIRVSLLELIERDAVSTWKACGGEVRRRCELDPTTIRFDWFQAWRDRFAGLDIELRVYELAGRAGIPVLVCWIIGREEFGSGWRTFGGAAAHGSREIALFKALAEAMQSRLTHIAGTRDDILPSRFARIEASVPLSVPPTPPGIARRRWRDRDARADGADQLAAGLAQAGYRRILFRRLDKDLDGIAVTKVFVPGLAMGRRSRRRPS